MNAVDDDDDDDAHPKRGDDDNDDCDENEAKSSKRKNRMQRLSETESGRAFERKLSAVEAPVGKVGDAIFGEEWGKICARRRRRIGWTVVREVSDGFGVLGESGGEVGDFRREGERVAG